MENDLVDLKMRHALNCWNDGLNDHLYGPPTIERATELAMAHKERDAALDHDWVAAPAYAAKVTMCREFRDRAERAEAELARKTEALRPFAAAADDAERLVGHDGPLGQYIDLVHLRAARSALEEKTDV